MTYDIFSLAYPGVVIAQVTKDGKVTCSNPTDAPHHVVQAQTNTLQTIIDQIQRGVATENAKKIRCIPGIERAQKKHLATLGELFSPPKKRGSTKGLKPISEENRYKGIDWPAKKEDINDKLSKGFSLMRIAKAYGVSPSTLSKANRQHGLYQTRSRVAKKRDPRKPQ